MIPKVDELSSRSTVISLLNLRVGKIFTKIRRVKICEDECILLHVLPDVHFDHWDAYLVWTLIASLVTFQM